MPTAFVTGGTGCVGLNLVEQLSHGGRRVIAIHRARSSSERLARLGAELRVAELGDASAIGQAMPEEVDAVFHVAGDLSFWKLHDERQRLVNVDGTRHVVEAVLLRRAKRFIHTSSVGGEPEEVRLAPTAIEPRRHGRTTLEGTPKEDASLAAVVARLRRVRYVTA